MGLNNKRRHRITPRLCFQRQQEENSETYRLENTWMEEEKRTSYLCEEKVQLYKLYNGVLGDSFIQNDWGGGYSANLIRHSEYTD